MKKTVLLVAALLSISATAMADETGYIRTGVEVGTKGNTWDSKAGAMTDNLSTTTWTLADGYFKGGNWGNFSLGYLAQKGHNEDNDNNGFTKIELTPIYGKSTKLGYFSGQVTFAQERWTSSASGSDTIKPKVSAVINVTKKSRLELKALYALTTATPNAPNTEYSEYGSTSFTTTDKGESQWMEAEVQYKQDLLGGTAGIGVYYGANQKDTYTKNWDYKGWWGATGTGSVEMKGENDNYSQVNFLANYAKYFSPIKTYASFYGEYRTYDYKYANANYKDSPTKVEAYQLGLYVSHNFANSFAMDSELKRTADLTKYSNDKYKTETTLAVGLKYNF